VNVVDRDALDLDGRRVLLVSEKEKEKKTKKKYN